MTTTAEPTLVERYHTIRAERDTFAGAVAKFYYQVKDLQAEIKNLKIARDAYKKQAEYYKHELELERDEQLDPNWT